MLCFTREKGRRRRGQRQSARCGEEVTFDCCGRLLGTYRAAGIGNPIVGAGSCAIEQRSGNAGAHRRDDKGQSGGVTLSRLVLSSGHPRFRLSRLRFFPSTVWLIAVVPGFSTSSLLPSCPANSAESSLLAAQNDGATLSVLRTYTQQPLLLSTTAR